MIGKTVSHYKIIEKLGEGGMGVVYKAQDTRLKRTVALKFLTRELTRDDQLKERFAQEAIAASALEHSNICTVYEIDETRDGQGYIVMAYYKGETLRRKLERGKMPISDSVDIALQMSRGLTEAHEAGIVHRDIKPANIIITQKGEVKILDFGLAKLAGKTKTKTGLTLGTVDYMSPEQAQGLSIDHRSDIWSVGVVLYEMLAGEKPFKGNHDLEVMYKIVNSEPESLAVLRADMSPALVALVDNMLEKNPEDRIQHVDEIISILLTIAKEPEAEISAIKIPSKRPKNTIAVLPFVNRSADPENEYFCDGLSEELINALSQLKGLRVVARASAFSFKGKDIAISEIGKKLKVNTVLDGSVRKAGNRLRIMVECINVRDGYQLLSERFDHDFGDTFSIQDEIAAKVVKSLKLKLGKEEEKALYKRYTDNLEAYNLYLKGRYHWNQAKADNLKKSIDYFNQALEIDPDFALPYCGLADAYWLSHQILILPAEEVMPKAEEAAYKALELDDTLSEAHAMVGLMTCFYDWDWLGAEPYFQKALELNPESLTTILWYSGIMSFSNRHEEAFALLKTAEEIDPLNLAYLVNYALRYHYAGLYERAIEECYKGLELEPRYWYFYFIIGNALLNSGEAQKAVDVLKPVNDMLGDISELFPTLGYAYGRTGEAGEADRFLQRLAERSKERYIPAYFYALIYAGKGDIENTFAYLEKAFDEHDTRLVWYLRDPLFSLLRSDKRYDEMVRRMNFPDVK